MKTLLFGVAVSLVAGAFLSAQDAAKSPSAAAAETKTPSEAKPAASAEWLLGKWIFDEEYTQKKYAESKPAEGLGQLVYAQLVEKLKGARITFTEKELIMTTKDGNGKAFAFEVIEAADKNAVTLKQTDGEVTTYHKEGDDRFWMASTGSVNVPFYFKRAE